MRQAFKYRIANTPKTQSMLRAVLAVQLAWLKYSDAIARENDPLYKVILQPQVTTKQRWRSRSEVPKTDEATAKAAQKEELNGMRSELWEVRNRLNAHGVVQEKLLDKIGGIETMMRSLLDAAGKQPK